MINKALYMATQKYPYYARGFAAMTPVEKTILSNGKPTLAIDKYWRIYWSKEALEHFKFNLPTVICHELEHLLREHSDRRQARNPKGWNLAADAEINDDLPDVPNNWILPSFFDKAEGLSAEEYYQVIADLADDRTCQYQSNEGSGVTGEAEEWELDEPSKSDTVGVEQKTSESLKDAIASDICNASKKNQGSVPSNVLLWAEARATGKLPRIVWHKIISSKLRKIIQGRSDWSYARLSRRQPKGSPYLLPSTISYTPNMNVVIDTSGSMMDEANWIAGILKQITQMHCDATLIDCDAEVHGVRKLKQWRDVLKSRGGGGTDMTIGIEYSLKRKADVTLVLTDGETPWPAVWPKNVYAIIKQGDTTEVRP